MSCGCVWPVLAAFSPDSHPGELQPPPGEAALEKEVGAVLLWRGWWEVGCAGLVQGDAALEELLTPGSLRPPEPERPPHTPASASGEAAPHASLSVGRGRTTHQPQCQTMSPTLQPQCRERPPQTPVSASGYEPRFCHWAPPTCVSASDAKKGDVSWWGDPESPLPPQVSLWVPPLVLRAGRPGSHPKPVSVHASLPGRAQRAGQVGQPLAAVPRGSGGNMTYCKETAG